MSSRNLNAVVLATVGSVMLQVFPEKTKVAGAEGEKDKNVVAYKLSDGTVVADDQLNDFKVTDADSLAEFNRLFQNMPVVKGGYYSYINEDGPTNPKIFTTFCPQGLAKIMAQALQAAHLIIGRGGEDATEMQSLLVSLTEYNQTAATKIAESKASNLADEIAKLNLSPTQHEQLLAKIGKVPAATISENDKERAPLEEQEAMA